MIVNATNIGPNLSGIGRYSLCISEFLLKHWEHPLVARASQGWLIDVPAGSQLLLGEINDSHLGFHPYEFGLNKER